MSGREYVDIITVGEMSIYNVLANPNGVLSANQGDLAVQTTANQPQTWKNVDGATAWTPISDAESRRTFGRPADLTTVLSMDGSAIGVNFDFTIPEDLTLKQISLTLVNPDVQPEGLFDASFLFLVNDLFVDAGPDSGVSVVVGEVPGSIFGTLNEYPTPDMNLRCPAGSTLRITMSNLSATIVPFQLSFTYTPGFDAAQSPNYMLGSSAIVIVPEGATASGTITVNSAPLAAGDLAELERAFDSLRTLTGVAGARTGGANDFDASLGTITGIRDEMLAAFSDVANSFSGSEDWDFAALDADKITVTAKQPGNIRNLDTLAATTTPGGGLSVSGPTLTGGLGITAALPIESPPGLDLLVHDLFVQGVIGEGIEGTEFFQVTELEIDGSPIASISGENAAALFGGRHPNTPVNLDVPAADGVVIEATIQTSGAITAGVIAALFCRPTA